MVSINVAQLLQATLGTVREVDFSEPLENPSAEVVLRGSVDGTAKLTLLSGAVLVQARYEVPVTLECARCLDPVDTRVKGDLDERFVAQVDVRTGTHRQDDDLDDPDLPRINDHHEVELDDVLQQDILTRLPMRPLCDAACPGLCETCGRKLDAGHGAPHPEVEPIPVKQGDTYQPFAGLAELLRQKNGAGDDERPPTPKKPS
jgi:uncharacterized protein